MRRLLLSFLGTGYLKPAPGTWGSLAAVVAALAMHGIGGPLLLCVAIVATVLAGTWATRIEAETSEDHDPGWIVIDEVAGQWIALLPVSLGAFSVGEPMIALWPGVLSAFLLFRLFDIWKPWIIGKADRRGDALGVMLDDVWAGVFAAGIVMALAALFHMVFL